MCKMHGQQKTHAIICLSGTYFKIWSPSPLPSPLKGRGEGRVRGGFGMSSNRQKGENMEFKGSRTERNVLTAFAGESQARNRYTYFAKQARKDGYEQIANIFAETADQECEHAKRLFKFLKGGDAEVNAKFPAGVIGKISENLAAAAAGEKYEWTEMYPGFAAVAREEGFGEIAKAFESIAVAEKQHMKRYIDLKTNVDKGRVFRREEAVTWRCIKCGYLHTGQEAPESCPACQHSRTHFEILGENW